MTASLELVDVPINTGSFTVSQHSNDEPLRPTRRRMLSLAGLVAGGLAVASCHSSRKDQLPVEPMPRQDLQQSHPVPKDPMFVDGLVRTGNTKGAIQRFAAAFPALNVKAVLPLPGLAISDIPWFAVSIVGTVNQLQIVDPGAEKPVYVLTLPEKYEGGIGSLCWHEARQTLYFSTSNKLVSWRPENPDQLTTIGNVPRALTLYDLKLDSRGNVWGGTYPTGSTFVYLVESNQIQAHSRLATDTDYVRRIAIGPDDQVWAGTGSRNPRLFAFPASAPDQRSEVPLPEPVSNGFITSIGFFGDHLVVAIGGVSGGLVLNPRTRSWAGEIGRSWAERISSPVVKPSQLTYNITEGVLFATNIATWDDKAISPINGISPLSLLTVGERLVVTSEGPTGLLFEVIDLSTGKPTGKYEVTLVAGEFKIHSVMGHSDGNIYVGGFMGNGLAAINPDSGKRWQSPRNVNKVRQIEGMIEYDSSRSYIGSYGSADIISLTSAFKDEAKGYSRLERLSVKYHQSRPFGWAKNSSRVFFGTVPDYGRAGGVLGMIDPQTNKITWVLDGGGQGFVKDQSIVGLAADERYVYGTSSVRNGYGLPDTEGAARVFKLEIATQKKIWERSPVASAGSLYAPILIAGWLLVADMEGILVMDPTNGELIAHHRLTETSNSTRRPGWTAADLVSVGGGTTVIHSAASTTTVVDFHSGTRSRIGDRDSDQKFGSRLATLADGRVFAATDETDLAELDLDPASRISNRPADLFSITELGQLQVRLSENLGNWATPRVISNDWNFATIVSFHMADWFNTGIRDLVVQRSDGKLYLHRATKEGFANATLVGTGFLDRQLTIGRIRSDSPRPSVLATARNGAVSTHHVRDDAVLIADEARRIPNVEPNSHVHLFDELQDGVSKLLIHSGKRLSVMSIDPTGSLKLLNKSSGTANSSAARPLGTVTGFQRGALGIISNSVGGPAHYINLKSNQFAEPKSIGINFTNEIVAGISSQASQFHGK